MILPLFFVAAHLAHASSMRGVPERLDHDRLFFQSSGSTGEQFAFVCSSLKIACGLELRPEHSLNPPATKAAHRRMTLKAALELIVKNNPQYQWQVQNEVLILSPRSTDRDSPLDHLIPQFEHTGTLDDLITAIASATGTSRSAGHSSNGFWSGSVNSKRQTTITVNFRNTPARAILNSVISQAGPSMWRFEYGDPATKTRDTLTFYTY